MLLAIAGLLVFLCVYGLLNLYIGWHGLFLLEWWLGPSHVLYWIWWAVVGLAAAAYILTRMPFIRGTLQVGLQWLGAWYIAIFYYSLLLLPILDVLYFVLVNGLTWSKTYASLLCFGIYLTCFLYIFLKGSWNARNPIIRKSQLQIGKSSTKSTTIKVAVASDLHLGHLVGPRHLQRLIDLLHEMKPDLILLPGDLVDDDPTAFLETGMSEQMRRLPFIAPLGVFAVLGNHEYYGRKIEQYVSIMETIGVRVLRDECVRISTADGQPFYVVGRKDFTSESAFAGTGGRLPMKELVRTLDHALPILMMDHQPRQLGEAQASGIDLLLCGHTHRGQFAPNHWITRLLFELDWGYKQKGATHVFVSSGFGTWGPPIRLASRAEILELSITFCAP